MFYFLLACFLFWAALIAWLFDIRLLWKQKKIMVYSLTAGLGVVFLAVFLKNVPAALIFLVLYVLVLKRREELKEKERENIIEKQAEVALKLIASFYENTGDLMRAMAETADCLKPPLAEDIKSVVALYNTNHSVSGALYEFKKRTRNKELNIFADAVILAEKYGADTGKVVKKISNNISHRISLQGDLRNEVRGQGLTLKIFMVAVAVLSLFLFSVPVTREIFITTAFGKFMVIFIMLAEYWAWYILTREVIDEL